MSTIAKIEWSDAVADTTDTVRHSATALPLSPFITEPDRRFVLDEDKFAADIEELPAFLSAPRPEYLRAADIMPVLKVLAGR